MFSVSAPQQGHGSGNREHPEVQLEAESPMSLASSGLVSASRPKWPQVEEGPRQINLQEVLFWAFIPPLVCRFGAWPEEELMNHFLRPDRCEALVQRDEGSNARNSRELLSSTGPCPLSFYTTFLSFEASSPMHIRMIQKKEMDPLWPKRQRRLSPPVRRVS